MKIRKMVCLLVAAVVLVGCGKTEKKPTTAQEQTKKEPIQYEKLSDEELEVYSLDGDVKAQMEIANRYDYGASLTGHDFNKAKTYYEMAAAQNNADAQRCLGYIYLNGCLGEQDLDKAMDWFQQAIANGDDDAYVGVGRAYLAGYGEVDQQKAKAFENIDTAYQNGRPVGVYYMAYLMEMGLGASVDYPKAIELYESVEKMEDLSIYDAFIKDAAQTRLGVMYVEGKGVEQNYDTALEYFTKSAKNDYAMAQYYMGQMYENGYGVDKNYEKAFDWYVKASEQEYAPAQNQLGYLYYKGNGVDADVDQAIYYHKLAAMQGYAAAQINLGYLYENGIGVEQNSETALKYYEMAAQQDNEGAKEAVARVQKQMNEKK